MGKKGAVLLHMLVMTMVLLSIATMLLQSAFATRVITRKSQVKTESLALLEGARAHAWDCLAQTNYGQGPSCALTGPQQAFLNACLPNDYMEKKLQIQVSGTAPPCTLEVRLNK